MKFSASTFLCDVGPINTGSIAKLHLRFRKNGFALIVTLMLMVLMVLIAVGLLQLASISMRSVDQQEIQAQARANARMSLMLAIGQLQKEMGPDARISAPSAALDTTPATSKIDGVALPHLTGVWSAAASRVSTFTLDRRLPTKVWRTWLTSGSPTAINALAMAQNGYASGTVARTLVAAGSDSDLQREVKVPLVVSGNNKAGFAWWTSDNGMKATLRAGEKPDPASASKALLGMRRSEADGHAALNSKIPTRANGLDARMVDVASVDAAMPGPADEQRVSWNKIHDLTTQSDIIPVDVTTSSLRQCLNTRLNWLEANPAQRAAAGTVGPLGSASTQDYRLFSWDQLCNYESLARSSGMMSVDATTKRPTIRTFKQAAPAEKEWNPTINEERFRVQPVLLKLSYVVSYATEQLPNAQDSTAPADPNKPYALRLYLYPIAVLWNPYNVDLTVPEYCVAGFCPLLFDVNKGQTGSALVDLTKNQSGTMFAFGPEMGSASSTNTAKLTNLVIPAGATKVLYPQKVNWQQFPTEYRYTARNFPWHYYMWADPAQKFSLGDNNFGGVIKNLRGNNETAYFKSNPYNSATTPEIMGAAGDTLRIGVTPSISGPSYTYGMTASHTDWWGNNGPGADNGTILTSFGTPTSVAFGMEADGTNPQISLIKDTELPTPTFGQLLNKPTPLLIYECYRKAADEDLFPSKFNSFSVAGNPVQAMTNKTMGADLITPWFESAYSFRFKAVSSWFDVTKTFQLPPSRDDRVFFGNSYSPKGQINVVDQEIPVTPLVSLAQLQHLPMFDFRPLVGTNQLAFNEGRATQFAQNHAIGNSYASPGIQSDKINAAGWKYSFATVNAGEHLRVDRSYIANSVLWDSWFCSSVAAQDGLLLQQGASPIAPRTARKVFEDFVANTTPLPNDAMHASLTQPVAQVTSLLFDANGNATATAYTRIAEYLRIHGGFNINSVSEDAWAHFLGGLLSRPSLMMASVTGREFPTLVPPTQNRFLISRYSLANAAPAEQAAGQECENRYWNGSREITASQIRELAAAIVRQVKLRFSNPSNNRGPFTSLAEFINRNPSPDATIATSGALQSALDDPAVSINATFRGDSITGTEKVKLPSGTSVGPSYPFPAAAIGPRRQGITGYVTQADLLQSIGPAISPRSDTFSIRALGEARDAQGNVKARAWCEAVVQRSASYVDAGDAASVSLSNLTKDSNKTFGRRFEMVSFRWLNRSEVE